MAALSARQAVASLFLKCSGGMPQCQWASSGQPEPEIARFLKSGVRVGFETRPKKMQKRGLEAT